MPMFVADIEDFGKSKSTENSANDGNEIKSNDEMLEKLMTLLVHMIKIDVRI